MTNLQRIRLERGLSQSQLSDKSGVNGAVGRVGRRKAFAGLLARYFG